MPALLERPKLSKEMAAALKHHILKERERKRQEEEEADKAIERKKEEQEKLRKKKEAESLSLEETREQIKSLEEKLTSLQAEKHELFLQLKKVLNEDENRRRQQMREKSDMGMSAAISHHQYHPAFHLQGPHMIIPSGHLAQRPPLLGDSPKSHMYRSQQQPAQSVHGVKRARSPSPPVVQLYPQNPVHSAHYPQGPYGQTQTTHSPYRQSAHTQYTTAQTVASTTYVTQASYPHSQGVHYTTSQSNPSKYQRDSAFSSYPAAHYVAAQQKVSEQYSGFKSSSRGSCYGSTSNLAVQPQQPVEQSTSKGGYAEDGHYQHKLQGQHVRSMAASSHAQALHAQQSHPPLPVHLQPQSKPSLLASYQRRKPEAAMYQQHKKPSQPHQQPPPQHGASYPSSQQPRTSSYPSQGPHNPTQYSRY
ncbi:uncharacterized protein [Amphiura filiformis]|uniref:uncharacterized protein n=1 Tax=Amphiura filiformis TaxID=82378 RepID=UPI003B225B54